MKATHKDRSKYCMFHKDYGHDTEDYHDLQNQIEVLIQRGHLGRYLKSLEVTPCPKGPVERQIDVISGGPAAGSSSSPARKAYACNTIANARVKRVMVDIGSSADVLYFDAFKRLGLTEGDLTLMTSALTGFTGGSISSLGTTVLPITIGEEPMAKTIMTTFMVVDMPSAYNIILGRPTLNKIKAMVSTYRRTIKFSTLVGIGEARSDPGESRQCYLIAVTLPGKLRPTPIPDPREEPVLQVPLEPLEPLIEVPLKRSRPDRTVKVGATLPEADQLHLIDFLRKNANMFAWSPEEMPGIDLEVA
ncbi:uncharacterized protein LOC135611539 [Musa acuminata AAA Group]|uniref:uncharacterized protein LOC135611539 n=1 Tax=Musa acuminata AAA Group TaxID=214697 RepID=UPI0031D7AC81